MMGIHDISPPCENSVNNPISLKKLLKGDGQYSTQKCFQCFDFDSGVKMLWLENNKQKTLLQILHTWLRTAWQTHLVILFQE
jgi:hypothetical protein